MRVLATLILISALISAIGCDGSAATVTSGVDQSVVIGDATDDQAVALCEASKEAAKKAGEMLANVDACTMSGMMTLAFTGDIIACETAVEECQAAGSAGPLATAPEDSEEELCDASFRDTLGAECTATVGDYEACGNAMLAAQQKLIDSLGCDTDVSADTGDVVSGPPKPDECVAFEAMGCSMGDESSSETGDI